MKPSKWLPILISTIALGVSFLSLWESHRGRLMNEEINRPILQSDGIESETLGSYPDQRKTRIRLSVKIKNIGRASAKLETGRIDVFAVNTLGYCGAQQELSQPNVVTGPLMDVLVGLSYTLIKDVDIIGCENVSSVHRILPTSIEYIDVGTGQRYSQLLPHDFELVLKPNQSAQEQK